MLTQYPAHDAMLGVKKADARSEVVHRKKKVKPKAEAKVEEEWSGVEDE